MRLSGEPATAAARYRLYLDLNGFCERGGLEAFLTAAWVCFGMSRKFSLTVFVLPSLPGPLLTVDFMSVFSDMLLQRRLRNCQWKRIDFDQSTRPRPRVARLGGNLPFVGCSAARKPDHMTRICPPLALVSNLPSMAAPRLPNARPKWLL
jgi:hypothetical protein